MRIAVVAITLITSIAIIVVAILNGTGLFEGAIKPTPTPVSSLTPTPTSPITDLVSLIDNLREAGATVDTGDVTQQPCFSVDVQVIAVNGNDVQVFEYEDTAAADAGAASISPDGFSINNATNNMTCQIGWVAPPHFYKASDLIVLYVGDSQAVIDLLELIVGPQFAGQ